LKCEDFDKIIHLFLDGAIDEKQSRDLVEHLSGCQRCSENLRELKNLDIAARKTRLPEPSPAYWQTFARKVSNEIVLRKKKPFWAKIKSAWESIFVYSPAKLRWSGAIASILLVFILGKLYYDYKGVELERIRTERMEKALSSQVREEPEKLPLAVQESLQIEDQKKIAPSAPAIPSAEEKAQKEKGKETPQGTLKTQTGFVTEDSTKDSIHVKAGRAGEVIQIATMPELGLKEMEKSGTLPETTVHIEEISDKKKTYKLAKEQPVSEGKGDIGLYGEEGIKYYKVDDNWVRVLNPNDTLVEVDTLKKVITSWSELFKEKPETEWVLEGFSQLKIAYKLLFLKTGEESILKEGIELLNKFKDSAVEQKIKDEINSKITELEALRKK